MLDPDEIHSILIARRDALREEIATRRNEMMSLTALIEKVETTADALSATPAPVTPKSPSSKTQAASSPPPIFDYDAAEAEAETDLETPTAQALIARLLKEDY